jgi:hypothetical protein
MRQRVRPRRVNNRIENRITGYPNLNFVLGVIKNIYVFYGARMDVGRIDKFRVMSMRHPGSLSEY